MGQALLLTLGHNASAIFLMDGQVMAGYEEERFTKIKSTSAFPINAITHLVETFPYIADDIDIYVSHWFIDVTKPMPMNKYWHPYVIKKLFPKAKIHPLTPELTHHDAHAYSALAFCGDDMPIGETMILVADGFGNFGQTMSIYWRDIKGNPSIVHRAFGFDTSLGLFFQYATSYLGLRENQDEYKLLGYEAHVEDTCTPAQQHMIYEQAYYKTTDFIRRIGSYDPTDRFDPVLTIDALPALRQKYYQHFEFVTDNICPGASDFTVRVVISAYVQAVIEHVVTQIIGNYRPKNIILAGGLFMNVKLNHAVADIIDGKVSIMPLAGDQGCGIGVYHALEDDFVWPGHLFWGQRDLSTDKISGIENLYQIHEEDMSEIVMNDLMNGRIVNVVRGAMEFGARALGHTSTLATPTSRNMAYINTANGRSSVMPMAPMVASDDLDTYFLDTKKVVKSLEYMICTRTYKGTLGSNNKGVSHPKPFTAEYTGRPQIIYKENDPQLYEIVKNFGLVINTSFNIHGKPIVFDLVDVIEHHRYQMLTDPESRIRTYVVTP